MPAETSTEPGSPTPLAAIPGIGPQRAEILARLGLLTHDDLLHYVPRRYEDRRHVKPISEAQEDRPSRCGERFTR
jgi:ATP-dependent DNA helicase RecG